MSPELLKHDGLQFLIIGDGFIGTFGCFYSVVIVPHIIIKNKTPQNLNTQNQSLPHPAIDIEDADHAVISIRTTTHNN